MTAASKERESHPTGRRLRLRHLLALIVLMTTHLVRDAAGATIFVTTVEQKISSSGGCSLQEAIYSANFNENKAIARYSGSTPIVVVTGCVPGTPDTIDDAIGDIIVLPAGEVLQLNKIVDDAINPTGPTATPIVTSKITILAYGATLLRAGSQNFRLFAVGTTGHLTIRRAYIKGFRARGGAGGSGGGGGMGAGGAVFVMGGTLVVEATTFEGNEALGGTGGSGHGGGGGGIGGRGGSERDCDSGGITGLAKGGGGGGGARGAGAPCNGDYGGGGGGTVSDAPRNLGDKGFDCGGEGGTWNVPPLDEDGGSGQCPGGGGGGGASEPFTGLDGTDGGTGHYGGGGGGGAYFGGGAGARGGFGGGGGASGVTLFRAGDAGDGGFGGGGGAADSGLVFDGNRGTGGFFAGNGTRNGPGGGGGGAGLGGAIFNDSGTVVILNSTLTGNIVGGGFSADSQDGSGGGGAIFSRNGHLTVRNATISGNLANFGGGIIVAQDSEDAPTSFVLHNTIIAGNGEYECAISGFRIAADATHNLIQSNAVDGAEHHREDFVGCLGVVATGDPQLGPLADNGGGTPTMAIASSSPAWNAADPSTSIVVDQRKQDRPEMGGFDIGAFELCLEGVGKFQQPCVILVGAIRDPEESTGSVALTMQLTPSGGGSTTPAPGTQTVVQDAVIPIKAVPNAGYRFVVWSSNVTDPANPSTTVVMNTDQTVTALFETCACAIDVTKSVGIKYSGVTFNPTTRRYVQTVTLTNVSVATITGPISLVLDKLTTNVTLYNATGTTAHVLPPGSPYRDANTNLAPGQNVSITLQFTNPNNGVFTYASRVLAGPGAR